MNQILAAAIEQMPEAYGRRTAVYPGTPGTGILDHIGAGCKQDNDCQRAGSQKVDEIASDASSSRTRAFSVFKHVGMNVAADTAERLSAYAPGIVLPGMPVKALQRNGAHLWSSMCRPRPHRRTLRRTTPVIPCNSPVPGRPPAEHKEGETKCTKTLTS